MLPTFTTFTSETMGPIYFETFQKSPNNEYSILFGRVLAIRLHVGFPSTQAVFVAINVLPAALSMPNDLLPGVL